MSFDAVRVFSPRRHRLVRFPQLLRLNAARNLVADVADNINEQAALRLEQLEQSVYSRPTTRFWVVQSNGRSTCGVSFKSASSPRSAIASTIFGARNASRMRRAT